MLAPEDYIEDHLHSKSPAKNESPSLLCIGGMHGNGHYALRSLIDGHSQIVAYPFFMANLFRSWKWSNLRKLYGKKLLDKVWPLIIDDPIFTANIGVTKEAIGFDQVEFSKFFFSPPESFFRGPVDLHSLLQHILFSYQNTLPRYKFAKIKYWAFEVDAREFPWEDEVFQKRVTHLFSYRDFSRSYDNHRADFIERHGWSLPKFLFGRGTLEMSQLIRNWQMFKRYSRQSKLVVFPFEKMRLDPVVTMTAICDELKIPFEPILLELTRNGVPEAGFTTEGKNKKNTLAPKGGVYLFATTASEKAIMAFAEPIDPISGAPVLLEKLSFKSANQMFWRDAFKNIPRSQLSSKGKFNLGSLAANKLVYSRSEALKFLKESAMPATERREFIEKSFAIAKAREVVLRLFSFLGLWAVYLTARFVKGQWRLWPHHILLIKFHQYQRLEMFYKRKIARLHS